jgi:hypothetical protein
VACLVLAAWPKSSELDVKVLYMCPGYTAAYGAGSDFMLKDVHRCPSDMRAISACVIESGEVYSGFA